MAKVLNIEGTKTQSTNQLIGGKLVLFVVVFVIILVLVLSILPGPGKSMTTTKRTTIGTSTTSGTGQLQ